MYVVIKYPALGHCLGPLGYAFRITGENFQPVVDTSNINAAFRIDISRRLLIRPINDDPGSRRARRGQGRDASNLDRLVGEIAVAIGANKTHICQHQKD